MIEFKSKAEMAAFWGVPEEALVEIEPGETVAFYRPTTPLPVTNECRILADKPEGGA